MQHAVCVRRRKKHKINPAAPKTQHEIQSSPTIATTSRRRGTKHPPRVSPCSPASIDLGIVEIGLVQLSQSVKTTNVTHRLTDTQRQTNKIMVPCTHPGTSREVNEARGPHILAAGRVRSKEKKIERKKSTKKSTPPKTHHDLQSSPATATPSRRRATKHVPRVSLCSPASIDAGFVEIGFVHLSQSVKTTYAHRQTQTDKLNNGTLYAPRYEEAF